MRPLLLILLLLKITFFVEKKTLEITFYILPELRNEFKTQPIHIELSNDNFKLDTFIINPNKVTFNNINVKTVWLRLSASIKCKDSITINHYFGGARISFDKNNKIERTITFPNDCKINKYLGGQICPVCLKKDMAIPIFYGFPSPYIEGEPGIDFDLGGCIRTGCDPNWFCKRDSTNF